VSTGRCLRKLEADDTEKNFQERPHQQNEIEGTGLLTPRRIKQ